ncbi:hypothetical protein TRFO_12443 [Tritrichomonas foetus]|uniref:RING-type domain-containing protein n=1 Tax=Tritrichomonas foetus TaxID=1144522 RepID=A0A1J4L1L4_9EUKA|nr:hypothetical protein TRFO_12443 [Tritrichomonas foetus]|eukprot:OHT17306.1 hypothetical protein TRFO_12443 [Tritrichomonas foetus]
MALLCSSCQQVINNTDSKITCQFCGSVFCSRCLRYNDDQQKILCPRCNQDIDLLQDRLNRPSKPSIVSCSHLVDVRVIQRDLVYIVGIPVQFANEDILLKYEFFGQYGPIKKVVVNSTHIHSLPNQKPSVSAYITFRNNDDALECIYSLENFSIDGNQLKASFGTTKYCSAFLRGTKCTNPDCMYLHHSGEQGDSFSKDEITGSSSRFVDMTRPSRPSDYNDYLKQDKRPSVFPPRRIMKKSPNLVKKMAPKETQRNSFLEMLAHEEDELPIVMEDPPGISLTSQLKLNRPSARTVFNALLMEMDET